MNKAVFLDKDGTLVHDVPYNVDPEKITFYEGVHEALHSLRQHGFLLIMVTNQGGLAKGLFNEEQLLTSLDHIQMTLKRSGVALDDILFCPHHPHGTVQALSKPCSCRKPEPGMLLEALEKWNVTPGRSWMIGDILNDVEAGNRAGLRTVLIDNGHETEWQAGPHRNPDLRVTSIGEAATSIINLPTQSFEETSHEI